MLEISCVTSNEFYFLFGLEMLVKLQVYKDGCLQAWGKRPEKGKNWLTKYPVFYLNRL